MTAREPAPRTAEHDPNHAYWCAVPWCPQYIRLHLAVPPAALREALDADLLRDAMQHQRLGRSWDLFKKGYASVWPRDVAAEYTRIVWKRDHGMVIVTGDEEPQSLEVPAWAVRTIFDVAGKDPEEEARKVSAFINAHTGLDVERLAIQRERKRILDILPAETNEVWWNPLNGPGVRVRAIVDGFNDGTHIDLAIDLGPSRCTECGELVTNRVHHEQSLGAYHLPRLAAYDAERQGQP